MIKLYNQICIPVVFVCALLFINSYSAESVKKDKDDEAITFPPCAACRVLVESFKKGIEKTSRGKFEGGDSAWEEDKLGSYKRSEIRLIEIQENLCGEIKQGKRQCQSLAEDFESAIEEWWFKKQDDFPELFDYLCIDQTKRCCHKDHFGPDCEKCPGFPDNVCSNNGKCKGSGTRKGSGKCSCDKGYTGDICLQCASGYYESFKDNKKLLCSPCHRACKGECNGGGPQECNNCNPGWRMVNGNGCSDINECLESNPCAKNQFCVNNDGNYSCLACDKACASCTGDGPDMCTSCAENYKLQGNMCVDSDILGRKTHENISRYATYCGLALATCIILQRNVYAAGVIGLAVGVYISVSEYMIMNSGVQDTIPNIQLIKKNN